MFRQFYKRNCHASFLRPLVGFGRAMYRFYENRNYDQRSNGEERVLRILSRFPCSVVFDVGANIGTWTSIASSLFPKSRFYCFEPGAAAYSQLERNASDRIRSFPLALAQRSGKLTLHVYPQGHELSSLYRFSLHIERPEITEVPVVSGDEFMTEHQIERVDFLKIDTEGHDLDVLKGFETALREKRIGAIQFEYGRINVISKALLYDFYDYLGRFGYRVGKIYPKTVKFQDYDFEMEDFIGPNFLAVRESESALLRELA